MLQHGKLKVGIIGATGYTGAELARLLHRHPCSRIEMITSTTQAGRRYGDIVEDMRHTPYVLEEDDWGAVARRCDAAFFALPHGVVAARLTKCFTDKCAVIDMGADFRLQDIGVYKDWYNSEHPAAQSPEAAELLNAAVYGLCEINREKIKRTRLVANPGCFTTCAILALYPIIAAGLISSKGIVIDAKTGISGAGKALLPGSMFCEVNEYMRPYGVASHRHTPEIEQALSIAADSDIALTFVPQIAPMERGILACSYGPAADGVTTKDLLDCLFSFYENEPFVRVMPDGWFPNTKGVFHTNFIDIGAKIDERTGRAIVISAIDNLVKGASGQAVQNMNIMFGIDETAGLFL